MRLPSQLLQLLYDRASKYLTGQVRYKHRAMATSADVPGKTECVEPCRVPRKSIWKIFGGKTKPKKVKRQLDCFEPEPKPVRECETVPYGKIALRRAVGWVGCNHIGGQARKIMINLHTVTEEQAEADMRNISEMSGGQTYRTCGTAYILQKDYIETPEPPTSSENEILEEISKHPSLKGQCDPMPPFQTVELRLIELNERKLHPMYKKLMSIPKRSKSQISVLGQVPSYKTRSGPFLADEIPAHLKLNREMFEKKNILCEFKRAEPPPQMMARIVEMRSNQRPPLVKKRREEDCSKK